MNYVARERAFTLVELLVVIFIIGLLVALLLPAIQAAREAARKTECKNNLKQLALAAITHEERHGHYPTNGWAINWVGDSDRGFGQDQPGGWAFNILPFLEEASLYDLAGDGKPGIITDQQVVGASDLAGTAIPVMYCPSRRQAIPYPWTADSVFTVGTVVNAHVPSNVGKLDYAINGGDTGDVGEYAPGPASYEAAPSFPWFNDPLGNPLSPSEGKITRSFLTGVTDLNGVSFRRSEVSTRHVTDGISNTYLIGEKHVWEELYETGDLLPEEFVIGRYDGGDRMPWTTGHGMTGNRRAGWPPTHDRFPNGVAKFGSAHAAAFHMAFCDGSVRAVQYDIDDIIHRAGAHRADGTVHGMGGVFAPGEGRR